MSYNLPKTVANSFTELSTLPTGICDLMDTFHIFSPRRVTTMAMAMAYMKSKSMCLSHSSESYILMQSLQAQVAR